MNPNSLLQDPQMNRSHKQYLEGLKRIAVFGASERPNSKGYRILQHLVSNGFHPLPINPRVSEIESSRCFGNLDEIPSPAQAALLNVNKDATLEILKSCKLHNIRTVWLEPGSETAAGCQYARENGIIALTGESFMNYFGEDL